MRKLSTYPMFIRRFVFLPITILLVPSVALLLAFHAAAASFCDALFSMLDECNQACARLWDGAK